MNKTLRSLLLSAMVAALPAAAVMANETPTLRIATEGAYPPFNYFTADGKLAGFDIEIGRALCAKMQAKCTFVAQDWDGIIPALLANKYDVIIASMFITAERRQKVDFTEPYQKSAMTFVVPKDSTLTDFSPAAMPSPRPSRKTSYATVQQLRQIADSEESPAEALRLMIKKEMARDDLSPAARNLFEQLLAFNPTTRGDEPKTERWTKLRLAHWCEAHFNIDSRITPTKEELQGIVDNFSKALMNKYL